MPGVVMENGSRNGAHTNHDRDQRPNGINVTNHVSEKVQEKGKGREEPQQNMTPISPMVSNGLNGILRDPQNGGNHQLTRDIQDQINQLPPEILHITQGYMSLKALLARQSQKTHQDLVATISELAQMPGPSSMANGSASHSASQDDNSVENLNKKLRLLKFASDQHEAWTKALVITGWSRRAEDVSKIIDLKCHLDKQRQFYEDTIMHMSMNAKNLFHARLPNPDLKTALEVLTTGKASWMPDLGYIKPPPLTAREIYNSLMRLNTILSIRLNLYSYDSMPIQFKDYKIHSGRVTFKVAGEFEVDLTVADEDQAAQFWFLDFRLQFWPALEVFPPRIRYFLEERINQTLANDGLPGCYKVLHEMVLTHKISEFRRQAVTLSRGKWIETLKVETLQRALGIQYWLDRYAKGPKSWVILGVHSGKRSSGVQDPRAASRLFLRWFRDSKEVKDVEISFDTVNISAESLLKAVTAKHIAHILTSIWEKLSEKPLFAKRELSLSLFRSATEPAQTELKVQLTTKHHLSVKINPINGRFMLGPASRAVLECEYRLNSNSLDPANEAHSIIEQLRYSLISEDLVGRGASVGWTIYNNPGLKIDELKKVMSTENARILWFRRAGWTQGWYMAVGLSMSGERWMLLQISNVHTSLSPYGYVIQHHIYVPIKEASPVPTYGFLSSLGVFTAALISQHMNLRQLFSMRALYTLQSNRVSKAISLPSINTRLSEILPSRNRSARTGEPWAKDIIRLTFQGLELSVPTHPQNPELLALQNPSGPENQSQPAPTPYPVETAVMITEARMNVPLPKSLGIINEKFDRDIAFHPESGSFAFRLRSNIGEPIIQSLVERATRVERLVDFVQVFQKHERTLKCETVSLGKIVFTYGEISAAQNSDALNVDASSEIYRATVDFSAREESIVLSLEKGNPHLRVVDFLTMLLNDPSLGLDGVATTLSLTLPIVRGLDIIESAWSPIAMSEHGEMFTNVRAADWYIIRYYINRSPAQATASPAQKRKITFEARLRHRRGEPWWYIRRTDNTREKEPDDIDEALKPLWAGSGPGWMGMRVSAVAQGKGAEVLLRKLDEVVRKFAIDQVHVVQSATTQVSVPQPPAAARAPAPNQPQRQGPRPGQQMQRQQQPTPSNSQNQSQNRNQGRASGMRQDVVEID